MRAYAFETYDVFSEHRFAGNPLAVVMNADGLTVDAMQIIAREFNLAETSFVLPPERPENAARVRIFTPAYEMPFAGHPTVGTAVAIARSRGLQGEVRLELKAGMFPVQVAPEGESWFAEFHNPNLPAETGSAPAAEIFEAALSLPSGSLDRGEHAPRCVGAGVNYYYLRAPLETVRAARIDSAAWRALDMKGMVGVYLYAEGGEAPDAAYHARMFAPDAGVFEDAATGSAAAALPGQIALSRKLEDGSHEWIIEQGFEMGRPSRIRLRVETHGGAVQSVRVGGHAVLVQTGELLAG